jgi:hypothetical protein
VSRLGRLLFPNAFRLADEASRMKAEADRLRMELDWAHVVEAAERLGVPLPVCTTLGELKVLLPSGILVVEERFNIIRLAFADQVSAALAFSTLQEADKKFLDAAVTLVEQALFVGVSDVDEYRYALVALIDAYRERKAL